MLNPTNLGQSLNDLDEVPALPSKRRLSASAWQTVWTLQMVNPLRAPDTIDTFVQQYNDERCSFGAKPRTSTKIYLSLTAVEMADNDMAAEVFKVVRALEEQYGPVTEIENRAVEHWPLYRT